MKNMRQETVYYKRADSTEWKGSGVVIGQDGAVVFIRHSGILVRVYQSRLSKVNAQYEDKPELPSVPVNNKEHENIVHTDVSEISDDEQC